MSVRRIIVFLSVVTLASSIAWLAGSFFQTGRDDGSRFPEKNEVSAVQGGNEKKIPAVDVSGAASTNVAESQEGNSEQKKAAADAATEKERESEAARAIAGLEGYSYPQRLAAVNALGNALASNDCVYLCDYLKSSTPSRDIQKQAAIKDALMWKLERQPGLPKEWNQVLLEIFEDNTQHPIIRDYALQHLFAWYEEKMPARGSEESADVLSAFSKAVKMHNSSIAGTGILGMYRLLESNPAWTQNEVAAKALELLGDDRAHPAARTTALQVCARLEKTEALDSAWELLEHQSSVAVRASAAAAIVRLGGQTQLDRLQMLIDRGNPKLANILRSAINEKLRTGM